MQILNLKGLKISTIIDYPKELTHKLAILCPGYLDTKDYLHLKDLAQKLQNNGYTVVRFDPTGTWESEGDILDYTVTQYLDDIKSIYLNMVEDYAYTNILIAGHSLGGMISLLYASRNPSVSKVLAIMPSSPYSMALANNKRKKWKEDGFRLSHRDIPNEDNRKEFKVPYSHLEDRDKYNVIDDVKLIKVPIVFIAGGADALINPKEVKRIKNNANNPKELIIIDNIGHDYRHIYKEIEKVNKIAINSIASI